MGLAPLPLTPLPPPQLLKGADPGIKPASTATLPLQQQEEQQEHEGALGALTAAQSTTRGKLNSGVWVAGVVTTQLQEVVQVPRDSSGEEPWQLTRVLTPANGLSHMCCTANRSLATSSF